MVWKEVIVDLEMAKSPPPFIRNSLFIRSSHSLNFLMIQGFGLLLLQILYMCYGIIFLLILFEVLDACIFITFTSLTFWFHFNVLDIFFIVVLIEITFLHLINLMILVIQICTTFTTLNQRQAGYGYGCLRTDAGVGILVLVLRHGHVLVGLGLLLLLIFNNTRCPTLHRTRHYRIYHLPSLLIPLFFIDFSLLGGGHRWCF